MVVVVGPVADHDMDTLPCLVTSVVVSLAPSVSTMPIFPIIVIFGLRIPKLPSSGNI